jgi:diguanylate cyclase (GGDEF)-like protein
MAPPLKKRLGFADRSAEQRCDRGLMARALMYAYATGALIALGSIALTGGTRMWVAGAAAAICCAASAVLLAAYDELPRPAFPALVALGSVLILAGVWEGGTSLALLLALPAAYAAYFLRKLETAALMALVLGGYAVAARAGAGQGVEDVAVSLAALAAVAGMVALQRANVNRLIWRLSDAAVTDELTGLVNRRGFQELFETELERARRSGQPLSVIVADLDHFKALNDRFGHAAGDSALEQLSLILRTAKRRIDTAARIGGEEFAVVLPDSDQHAALILAERMRREVRETFMYEPYDLTISIGVATFPLHGTEPDALIAQADEALYAAKALGRDRSVVWGEDLDGDVLSSTGIPTARSEHHAATVRALADVVDARDRLALAGGRPLRRGDRARAGAAERGDRADQVRRHRARRGQDRGAGQGAAQAGLAERRGLARDAPPPGDRRADPVGGEAERRERVGARPPRAPGRHRLPARAVGPRDPRRGTDPRCGRRIRGDDLRPRVPLCAAGRGGAGRARALRRHPVRPARGGRLPARARLAGRAARASTRPLTSRSPAGVVQLVRTPACHAGGRRFESGRSRSVGPDFRAGRARTQLGG